jgi:hypothetical protein
MTVSSAADAAACYTLDIKPPPGLELMRVGPPPPDYVCGSQETGENEYYQWMNHPNACHRVLRQSPPPFSMEDFKEITAGELPVLAPPPTGGKFGWNNKSSKPAPHIRSLNEIEEQGTLTAGVPKSVLRWCRVGGRLGVPDESIAATTLYSLKVWIKSRPHLFAKVRDATAGIAPPGLDWGGAGWWLTLHLTGNDDRKHSAILPALAPLGLYERRSFHATSLYCLNRIVHRGLQEGMARNSNGKKMIGGIFSHATQRAHLTLGYCHFVPLDGTGNLVGPIVEIRSPQQDPQARPAVLRRSGGNDQWLSYNETTELVAAHFFVIRPSW